ncbi:MAG: fumarylacetoacetate hydrolase family protein [Bacteroidia bacterium]|nr:fumarylacetoacetate hydrolase family protein [Bacteroidota bacterium]MBK7391091.1 fumarylacetoacetate hydrolase family protein [Bacteroidota bacterium]MBK9047487.1 fumarylacetoacetate hydrolase family protein [Bacteroidota bacterium]MBK9425751.1 fumarylacetoacetate hydrolase family protein [Bacteroidota bacterium]MBP9082338.1 fumarylacetoacetate hydrolase family protein [Bacteroidia bacterium]
MKIICVGRNYAEHAKELNNPVNEQPVIFLKPETAQNQQRQPFFLPDFSADIHYETEIVVKICKLGKNIQEKFAHKYYEEIGIGIDFTARDLQASLKAKGLPWELAKGFDGSAPVGKFVDKSSFEDVQQIDFSLKKNGQLVQSGNTSDMIFKIDTIIAFVSQYFTLKKGDLIFTGTPKGVGPVVKGDLLEAFIGEMHLLTVKVR